MQLDQHAMLRSMQDQAELPGLLYSLPKLTRSSIAQQLASQANALCDQVANPSQAASQSLAPEDMPQQPPAVVAPPREPPVMCGTSVDTMLQQLLGSARAGAISEASSPTMEEPPSKKKPAAAATKAKGGNMVASKSHKSKSMKSAVTSNLTGTKKTKSGSGKPTCTLAFPGLPKKWVAPINLGGVKIYTDINRRCWRVKWQGVHQDRAAAWSKDPRAAWKQVLQMCNE